MANSDMKFESVFHDMCITDSYVKFDEKLEKLGFVD